MQLNNLESAWKQLKLMNTMEPFDSNAILTLLETESQSSSKFHRMMIKLIMVIVITIICTGG